VVAAIQFLFILAVQPVLVGKFVFEQLLWFEKQRDFIFCGPNAVGAVNEVESP
jgi:hypothetical protein